MYIASEGGRLYHCVDDELDIVYQDPSKETLMGLASYNNMIIVGAKSKIIIAKNYKTILDTFSVKSSPDFHAMNIYNDFLYMTCTSINQIWIFDLSLPDFSKSLVKKYEIRPPMKSEVVYKKNYNHINCIIKNEDRFYVGLNWNSTRQYSKSGIAVLTSDFTEIDRFDYGWETHALQYIDGVFYCLCASSGIHKNINHPNKSGLMVNSELKWEHCADTWFCKDFKIDKDTGYYYIVGGRIKERGQRGLADGVLFVLDQNMQLLSQNVFTDSGGFTGILL